MISQLPGSHSWEAIRTWFFGAGGPHTRYAGLLKTYGVMSSRSHAESWLRTRMDHYNAILVARYTDGENEHWLVGGAAREGRP